MKTAIQIMVVVIALLLPAHAAEYKGAEIVTVGQGDTLGMDLFAGCRYTEIYGVVKGDVYAGCERITIDGEVTQDVLAGCEELQIHGKVGDMVIFFGSNLLIDGEIGGDVLAFGGKVRLTERAVINGNLFIGAGYFNMEGGLIGGNIRGGVGRALFNGIVGEDVELETGSVRFGENYRSAGGTRLTLHEELDEEKAGYIPENLETTIKKKHRFFQGVFFYWSLIAMFIVGILIIAFFKDFSRDYVAFSGQSIAKHLGVGFLALVAAPVAIVILLILVFTIPVALITLAIYLILLYFSFVFTALYVGDYLLGLIRKDESPKSLIWPLLLGVILVLLFPKLPFIGWFFALVIMCFGLGTFVSYIWNLKQTNGTQTA
jgi:hypothetical protein